MYKFVNDFTLQRICMKTKLTNISTYFSPTRREWFFFIVKIAIVLLIGVSFRRFDSFYFTYPLFNDLAIGLNTFLSASVLISIGRYLLISWYLRRSKGTAGIRGNVVLGINQFSGILNTVFAVVGAMLALGINPGDFLTSITLVAMAIALLFRDYITNMISGLIIMFSDQFTIGDNIKIGNNQGKIIDITLSNIIIRDEDEDVVLIPNNSAFTVNIINRTLENKRRLTIDFQLPLERSHHKEQLSERLRSMLVSLKDDVVPESISFRIVAITHLDVHFKLGLQVQSRSKKRKSDLKNLILTEILNFDAEQLRQTSRN